MLNELPYTDHLCFVWVMASKRISLSESAYERLVRQRRGPGDSFSLIVMRARWVDTPVTAGELLVMWDGAPPFFNDSELLAMESSKREQAESIDKWKVC